VNVLFTANIKTVHKISFKSYEDILGSLIVVTIHIKRLRKFCFSANIGGWLGISMGASIISLMEIIFFGIHLLKIFLLKLFKLI